MFARAYGTAIRPISLGRELLGVIDSMDNQSVIDPHFVINLNADDFAAFADIEKHLLRELTEAATQYAEQNGFKHDLPITVALVVDESLKSGRFTISSRTAETQEHEPKEKPRETLTTHIIPVTQPLINAVLVLLNGERVVLDGDSLKIGRQATCRVVFNDSNVSREHAQMRRTADGWKVLDLNSTNGVKINGRQIVAEQLLVNGDELAFGTSTARFEIS